MTLRVAILIASAQTTLASSQFELTSVVDEKGRVIEGWVDNNQPFTLRLKQSNNPALDSANGEQRSPILKPQITRINEFRINLGDTDISSLFEFQNNRLTKKAEIPLPHGEHLLTIKQKWNNQWITIGEANLSILSSAGFKQAAWTPRLELNINSQLDEQVTGDATPSNKPTFTELTASIGLSSHHQNDDLTIESNFNLFAVSNREQAIQFSNKSRNATKLDLSDYSISINKGDHQIVIGHTSYGNNSLLIDGLSRRGVSWHFQNEDQLAFNGAILSGSDLVGYNNFFGFSGYSKQFVNSLGFGVNMFSENRISVRLEGSYLDAERISQNDFGIGEITSAEKNQGLGIKLIASDSEGRLNADLVVGLSQYTNPDDLALSLGEQLVNLDTETALAHNLNLSYVLVQDWVTPWGPIATINLNANHSSAEPLYQTLTAFVQANIENKIVGAQYQFGHVSGNLSVQSSRDNLDNIVSLLTTKTKTNSASVGIPLPSLLMDEENQEAITWLPNIDINYQQTHQFAISSPEQSNSGFNDNSHLPDQVTDSYDIAESWQLERNSFSLQTSFNKQDNRQVGREQADFSNLLHSANFNYQQNDTTSWTFSLSKNRQNDIENKKIQYADSVAVSYNWQSIDGLAISFSYGLSKEDDSLNESRNTATTADLALIKNLTKGEWWLPANGSISVRVNYNDSQLIDNVFDQRNTQGTTTALLSLNLSL